MSTSNDIPMYLVPGRLTDGQKLALQKHVDAYDFDKALEAIGIPIQPCADVETVGVHYEVNLGYYGAPSVWKPRVSVTSSKHLPCRDITPLVRRVDMAAQVTARDMKITQLAAALQKARDALISVTEGRTEQYQARNGRWMSIQAEDGERCDIIHSDISTECEGALEVVRAALNEGAAS